MPERTRLTIAGAATTLLLAAVSVAGVALHTGPPAPTARAPVALTTPVAHTAPTPGWHEEHD